MDKGIFGILGAVIGFLLNFVYNYWQQKNDRKDKYFFALLEKRFETYQEAYLLCEKLKRIYTKPDGDTIKSEVIENARNWFNSNNLYLSPFIRENLDKHIGKVLAFRSKRDIYHEEGKRTGYGDEIQKERNELNENIKEITEGLQKKIQNDLNIYYKYLEIDSPFKKLEQKILNIINFKNKDNIKIQ